MIISFIVIALVLGGICFIVSMLPIAQPFKMAIYVVCAIGLLIWLLQHLSAFGVKV